MLYPYEYSSYSDCHTYHFSTIPITLNLCLAHYAMPDIGESLNLYQIDLINREEAKKEYNVGRTLTFILYNFLIRNKHCVIGYYPVAKDNKEHARVQLFNQWMKCHVDTQHFFTIKNKAVFRTEEELILQVFRHNEYPYQNELIANLNSLSQHIQSK
jgi:hypothetical protein